MIWHIPIHLHPVCFRAIHAIHLCPAYLLCSSAGAHLLVHPLIHALVCEYKWEGCNSIPFSFTLVGVYKQRGTLHL
ncbi:hypothetical protein BKA93DRAFT_767475 [Sparassis latifolia]